MDCTSSGSFSWEPGAVRAREGTVGRGKGTLSERMGNFPDENCGGREVILRDDGRPPAKRNICPLGYYTLPAVNPLTYFLAPIQ